MCQLTLSARRVGVRERKTRDYQKLLVHSTDWVFGVEMEAGRNSYKFLSNFDVLWKVLMFARKVLILRRKVSVDCQAVKSEKIFFSQKNIFFLKEKSFFTQKKILQEKTFQET